MNTLRAIVAAETDPAEELPIVHTTRCEVLPHIVASHELRSVTLCDVFHEHLIYFFYGRPAYRHVLRLSAIAVGSDFRQASGDCFGRPVRQPLQQKFRTV